MEERLALASEGADYEIEDRAVSVACAVVLYLAGARDHGVDVRDPPELTRLAARLQWHGHPPVYVSEALGLRGVPL